MKLESWQIVALIIGAVLIIPYLKFDTQAIYSTGSVMFDSGKDAWTVDVYMSNIETEPAKVIFSTAELSKTSLAKGDQYNAQYGETVEISFLDKKCAYDTTSLYTLSGNGIYKIENPQLDYKLNVKTYSDGVTKVIDLKDTNPVEVRSAKNGGQITTTVVGAELQGYCYIPDNLRVLKLFSKTFYVDWDKVTAFGTTNALCGLNPITQVACFVKGTMNPANMLNQRFITSYTGLTFDGVHVAGTPVAPIARIHTIVTADKAYFNAQPVAVLPTIATPDLTSPSCSDLKVGSTGSMSVKLKNTGKPGDIVVTANSAIVSVDPSSTGKYLATNEETTLYFSLNPKTVSVNTDYVVNIKADSTAQLGSSNADTITCSGTVRPITSPLPPSSQCPNGVCDATESYSNCPADCKNPTPITDCAKIQGSYLENNQCVCAPGYELLTESSCDLWCKIGITGKSGLTYCKKISYTWAWVAGIGAFLVALYIVTKNKKSGRKR